MADPPIRSPCVVEEQVQLISDVREVNSSRNLLYHRIVVGGDLLDRPVQVVSRICGRVDTGMSAVA